MNVRTALPLIFLSSVLVAAPALAIDISTGGIDGSGSTIDPGTADNIARGSRALSAASSAPVVSCSESLRGFSSRNTIRPSERKAALKRCAEASAVEGWATRTSTP